MKVQLYPAALPAILLLCLVACGLRGVSSPELEQLDLVRDALVLIEDALLAGQQLVPAGAGGRGWDCCCCDLNMVLLLCKLIER